MDREPAEVGDSAPLVRAREAHRSRALAVDLDDEEAERGRVRIGSRDLGPDLLVTLGPDGREEGLDVGVGDELDEEVDVVVSGAADRDVHAALS
jgi:hypothetical protein